MKWTTGRIMALISIIAGIGIAFAGCVAMFYEKSAAITAISIGGGIVGAGITGKTVSKKFEQGGGDDK